MRIISLYQPYATLVVLGLKTFETRSWNTHVRGELGIHASAKIPKWCKELLSQEPFASDLKNVKLVRGAIVGTVSLVDTMTTQYWREIYTWKNRVKEREWEYGDYTTGRYAWKLTSPEMFDKPIPAKGSMGFWKYDTEKINRYTGQLSIF